MCQTDKQLKSLCLGKPPIVLREYSLRNVAAVAKCRNLTYQSQKRIEKF